MLTAAAALLRLLLLLPTTSTRGNALNDRRTLLGDFIKLGGSCAPPCASPFNLSQCKRKIDGGTCGTLDWDVPVQCGEMSAVACCLWQRVGNAIDGYASPASCGGSWHLKSDDGDVGWAVRDPRNVSNGLRIFPPLISNNNSHMTYQDQPQTLVLPDGSWFVVWTHGIGGTEGAGLGNRVLSARSTDQGTHYQWLE